MCQSPALFIHPDGSLRLDAERAASSAERNGGRRYGRAFGIINKRGRGKVYGHGQRFRCQVRFSQQKSSFTDTRRPAGQASFEFCKSSNGNVVRNSGTKRTRPSEKIARVDRRGSDLKRR